MSEETKPPLEFMVPGLKCIYYGAGCVGEVRLCSQCPDRLRLFCDGHMKLHSNWHAENGEPPRKCRDSERVGYVPWHPVKPPSAPDPINHPPHYTSHPSGVECIQITEHMDFLTGNAMKYLWRAGQKEGASRLEDLKKCAWYVQRAIQKEES